MDTQHPDAGLGAEVRLILARAKDVWRLVPGRHRWALGGAGAVMALTSASNTAVALLLGSLVVVDIVTERCASLHHELLELLRGGTSDSDGPGLYAVSYRSERGAGAWQLDTWPAALILGRPLPTLPLWLTSTLAGPLDLESSYGETCRVLRIE